MNGHTSNRQIQSVIRGMIKDAQRRLDEVAGLNQEAAEYWIGFMDSLKQLDTFLYLDTFKDTKNVR